MTAATPTRTRSCPTCDGTGAGDGYGPSGAGGMCRDCRGEGSVTYEKATRLEACQVEPAAPEPSAHTVESVPDDKYPHLVSLRCSCGWGPNQGSMPRVVASLTATRHTAA